MKRLIIVCLLVASPASAQSFGNYQAQIDRAINELHLRWEQCRHPDGTPEDNRVDEVCPGRNLMQLDDRMKGTIFLRAAYYIHELEPSLGILVKTGGANINGYATDLLIERGTGYFVDTLTTTCCDNGQRYAVSRWAVNPPDANTSDMSRWRAPTRELAGLSEVPPVVTPPVVIPPVVTPPVSGVTLSGIQAQLAAMAAQLTDHAAQEEAHWANVKGVWEGTFKPILTFIGKYVAPIVGGWLLGAQVSQ